MDMRSRGGFSGSPVWVWRTPLDDLAYYTPQGTRELKRDPFNLAFLCFAGIHRGQFPETATVLGVEIIPTIQRDTKIEIASAMTVTVPAWEISALMCHPKLTAQREARDARPERVIAARNAVRYSNREES
jgi:hypothetical protein